MVDWFAWSCRKLYRLTERERRVTLREHARAVVSGECDASSPQYDERRATRLQKESAANMMSAGRSTRVLRSSSRWFVALLAAYVFDVHLAQHAFITDHVDPRYLAPDHGEFEGDLWCAALGPHQTRRSIEESRPRGLCTT
jgi:hypothetical protein